MQLKQQNVIYLLVNACIYSDLGFSQLEIRYPISQGWNWTRSITTSKE